LVDGTAPGVAFERLPGFDQLRGGWVLDLVDAPCERLGDDDVEAALTEMFDRAAVLTAFEQIGGADACLEMARGYAIERRAFGRAIGSFQAIKHKLADMLTNIELARSNAYYAAWALANNAADKSLAAATARVSATEAYEFAARENMQVHGGISFTWEANCHFHYRRSRLLALSLGASSHWYNRIIDELATSELAA
jgi:alkylation response protein AidB-like acyl-CoA dehydrogenase